MVKRSKNTPVATVFPVNRVSYSDEHLLVREQVSTIRAR